MEGAGQDGWMDHEDTWGDQSTARTGTPWSDGHKSQAEVGASGITRPLNPSAGTCPDFSSSCRSSCSPCFVPGFALPMLFQ